MILIKRGEIVRQDEVPKLIAEMDGLVWEFVAQENEVVSIQKEYLVSNLSVGKEGMEGSKALRNRKCHRVQRRRDLQLYSGLFRSSDQRRCRLCIHL